MGLVIIVIIATIIAVTAIDLFFPNKRVKSQKKMHSSDDRGPYSHATGKGRVRFVLAGSTIKIKKTGTRVRKNYANVHHYIKLK